MELVPVNEINTKHCYYIPHHFVTKESSTSTKLRVVFDASAKSSSGKSLNSILAPGLVVQPQMVENLLNFRLRPVSLVADISKMYRQIKVNPDQFNLQRLVWRRSPSEPLRHYRLKCVVFGISSSPYLATRVLLQLADDEAEQFPLGSRILKQNFYVDDLMCSLPDAKTAIHAREELLAMLSSAQFSLR